MHKVHKSIAALCLLSLLGGALTGCNAKTEMSKQEEQSFKGTGKMSPEAATAIAKQLEDVKQKIGEANTASPQSVHRVNN